jgi:ankyrin repeat protein
MSAPPSSFEQERAKLKIILEACDSDDVAALTLLHSPEQPLDEYKDAHGASPLHFAARSGSLKAVQFLAGACSPGAAARPDRQGRTPLMSACASSRGLEVVRYLLSLPESQQASGQAQDEKGATALHLAACCSGDMTQLLLQAGADPNAPSAAGPPLMWALGHNGPASAVQALIQSGADVDAQDENGATPLILACLQGEAGVTAELMKRGAKLDAFARNLSPLAAAAVSGSLECCELLVKAQPDLVRLRDPVERLLPVEVAAHACNRAVCAFLARHTDVSMDAGRLIDKFALERAEQEAQDVARSEASEAASQKAREEGNVLFRAGEFEQACAVYAQGLSGSGAMASPRSRAVLLTNMSLCMFRARNLDASRDMASQAVSLDASYIKAHARLAQAWQALGNHEESARFFWQAYQMDKAGKEAGVFLTLFNEQIAMARAEHQQGVKEERPANNGKAA